MGLLYNFRDNISFPQAIGCAVPGGREHLSRRPAFCQIRHRRQQHQHPVRQEWVAAVAPTEPTRTAGKYQSAADAAKAKQHLAERLRPGTGSEGRGLFSMVGRPAGQHAHVRGPDGVADGQRPGWARPSGAGSTEQCVVDLGECPFFCAGPEID